MFTGPYWENLEDFWKKILTIELIKKTELLMVSKFSYLYYANLSELVNFCFLPKSSENL